LQKYRQQDNNIKYNSYLDKIHYNLDKVGTVLEMRGGADDTPMPKIEDIRNLRAKPYDVRQIKSEYNITGQLYNVEFAKLLKQTGYSAS